MIAKAGQIIAIDSVKVDNTLSGDGVRTPLGVKATAPAVSGHAGLSAEKVNNTVYIGMVPDAVKVVSTDETVSIHKDIEEDGTVKYNLGVSVEPVVSDTKINGGNGIKVYSGANATFTISVSGDYVKSETLNDYYTKNEANTNFQTKGDYVEESEIQDMATKTWVSGNFVENDILDSYYTKDEVYSKSETYSKNETYNKDEVYTKQEVDDLIPDISNLALSADVDTAIAENEESIKAWANDEFQEKGDYAENSDIDSLSSTVNENFQKKGEYVTSADTSLVDKALVLKNNKWEEAPKGTVYTSGPNIKIDGTSISGRDWSPELAEKANTSDLEGLATQDDLDELSDAIAANLVEALDETSAWANETFQPVGDYLTDEDLDIELSGNAITAISGHPLIGTGGGTQSDYVYYPDFDETTGNIEFKLGTIDYPPSPIGGWHISGADGATGPQGTKGDKGDTGAPGAPGAKGDKGDDGISPTVSTSVIDGGNRVTFTYGAGSSTYIDVMSGAPGAPGAKGEDGQKGTDGKDGKDGTNGKDGVSPTVSSEQVTGGTKVTFTYGTSQTETITVLDGTPGAAGASGFSPTVSTEAVTAEGHPQGGTKVTITDLEHQSGQEFYVWNGTNGQGATVNLLEGTGIKIDKVGQDYTIGVSGDYAENSDIDSLSSTVNENFQKKGKYVTSAENPAYEGKALVLKDNQWVVAPEGTVYTPGPNIDITNNVISGYDWTPELAEKANTSDLEGLATQDDLDILSDAIAANFVEALDETSAWANETFQPVGDYLTDEDLENYYTKSEVNDMVQDLANEFDSVIDSVSATIMSYDVNSSDERIDVTDTYDEQTNCRTFTLSANMPKFVNVTDMPTSGLQPNTYYFVYEE